ncbi:acyl carrier protein [Aquimarina sp. AD10]|uniref:Acyl carrier protein n=1 Tax=Aquimarina aggregata TaxID=1642818 RepID=A0A162CUS5_9FLAO|nr:MULTISPECIES: phosphopantetheine-binding protein [Aquimarina]AXT59509.1 acyl carrier protein [Aquimarina sp. AD10]KZS42494.1 acyl carrier protein [Aquimarina aggregata]RKN00410.1 acyl carrier protein [Aquimarina sp. AD10]
MNKEELLSKLKTIITPYVQNQEGLENLTEDTDFIQDLEINSANLVDVILDVEDEFDIEIDNEAMEKMLTVKASLVIIEEKLNEK